VVLSSLNGDVVLSSSNDLKKEERLSEEYKKKREEFERKMRELKEELRKRIRERVNDLKEGEKQDEIFKVVEEDDALWEV
jgi:ABC-type uncharacterized transport system ATPase component